MIEGQLYEKAARLAFLAMGKEQRPTRRGNKRLYLADEDPLAHWELTERIVELAKHSRTDVRPAVCAKCGCETGGEVALVNGDEWCHPCADEADMLSDVGAPPHD